jgi:hypothetical protein
MEAMIVKPSILKRYSLISEEILLNNFKVKMEVSLFVSMVRTILDEIT